MLKVIAFDLDGTIAETFPIILSSFKKTVYQYTNKNISSQEIFDTFGLNEIGMLKTLIPNFSPKMVDTFYHNYKINHKKLVQPFLGIKDLIKFLKSKKILTIIITGKGKVSTNISLSALKLKQFFPLILTGSDKGPNKLHRLKQVIKKYHLTNNEIAYISDDIRDIKVCKKIGIICFSAGWANSSDLTQQKKYNNKAFSSIKQLKGYLSKILCKK